MGAKDGQVTAEKSREGHAPSDRVGTVIRGKWRIEGVLGVGGMASVYAARHTNGRRAALKIMHRALAGDPQLRDRFLREGYLGNKIAHPGRVECLDDDVTEDGEHFLVMELLEGETLDAYWKRCQKRVPVVAALRIADQLLDFLSACHAVDIVHRDLKPANIFLTNEARVKVLDFGIAQLREAEVEHTRAGLALGTPSFMSPEQARGRGDQLDGRADIFSVGAVLYAVLSGTRLHKGRSSDESLVLAATQPAPSLVKVAPDLPVEVIALVDKALSWDRRNRFASAAEMRTAVLEILGRMAAERRAREAPPPGERQPSLPDTGTGPAPLRDEPIADDHPDVVRLRSVFKQLERVLPAVRQYGWSHPESGRRTRASFEEIAAALRDAPTAIVWSVRPYSFAHRGREVWEPGAPLDGVPYALFDAGIRTLRLLPGLTEPELRKLLELFLLDTSADLAPEDDLATLLWEAGLAHVRAELADCFAEGGAAEREAFFEQADELEALARKAAMRASRVEARAMSVSTDGGARAAARPALGLDQAVRVALGAQLELSPEAWTERYVETLVDAYLDARRRGDTSLLTTPLRSSSARLVASGRVDFVRSLRAAVLQTASRRCSPVDLAAVSAELGSALLGGAALALLVRQVAAAPPISPARTEGIDALIPLFDHLDARDFEIALDALERLPEERVRLAALRFIDRNISGHEQALAARVPALAGDAARGIVTLLARRRTPASSRALAQLTEAADPTLRVEVAAALAIDEAGVRTELMRLADDPRADVRLAALRAMARRRIKEAGPLLVRRVEDASYHDLAADERAEILGALHELNPPRTEELAIALLATHGMVKSDARDQTRVIAARHLAAHGRSAGAVAALTAATRKWWWNSDELRSVATDGLAQVQARLGTS